MRKYNYHAHIHQYAELVIPTRGSLSITVDGKSESFGVGKAAFIFPFQVHEYKSTEYNELKIFVFSPSLIPELFNSIDGLVGDGAVFTPQKSTLDILTGNIIEKKDFGILDLKSALYFMVSDYISCVSLSNSKKKYNLATEIVKYIDERYSEKITVLDIAKALGCTRRYLSSEIKSFFGDDLSSLMSAIRIDKATRMLLSTDKPCSQIAYACGFGSERSFYRQFKSIVGFSPSEYRKNAVISGTGDFVVRIFED